MNLRNQMMTWDLDCLTEQILSQQQELCLNKKIQQKQIVVLLLSLCIDINVLFIKKNGLGLFKI